MLGEAGGAHEKGAFPSYKEAFIKMFFFYPNRPREPSEGFVKHKSDKIAYVNGNTHTDCSVRKGRWGAD